MGRIIFEGEIAGKNGIVFSTVIDKDMIETLDLPEGKVITDLFAGEALPVIVAKTEVKKEDSKPSGKTSSKSADSIRVRTDILSRLVDTAGEMVLGRNRIMDVVGSSISDLPGIGDQINQLEDMLNASRNNVMSSLNGSCTPSVKSLLEKEYLQIGKWVHELLGHKISDAPGIGAIFQDFSQISSDLQNGIMGTRLQPVSSVFSKFPRVIRDMNKKLGKEIELIIEGGDVELDKSVIEGLGDPLTHLVRNSCDHGVETPEVREASGKDRRGIVKLIARHEGGQVHIIIEDDGAGINVDRIKEKAVENGMMSQDEADALPDKEVFKLIFAAGFSTAKVVSDVSGRGVGMDVVRTNIEKLGGRIEIDSIKGEGSTLTLMMPLTLAIIPSLGVTSSNRHFAIPQVAIEELVRVIPDEMAERIATVNGSPVLKLRDTLLPLVRLNEILGHTKSVSDGESNEITDRRHNIADRRSEDLEAQAEDVDKIEYERKGERRDAVSGRMYIVVLKALGSRFGLIVDRLHEPQEVVVKPLSERLKNIGVYAGATIRSDGSVAMILDADGIARDAKIRLEEAGGKAEGRMEHINIREAQTMLEFTFGTEDRFAVNLSMVSRVEEINMENLHKTGNQEFLQYKDSSLRVIRLHNHLDVSAPEKTPDRLFVLVPRLVPYPIGILIEKPIGIFETDAAIDTNQISGEGIHGSQVIDSKMIVFLDLYTLFEKSAPELYERDNYEDFNYSGKRILLAEDTALFRTVIGDFLKSIFDRVDIYENGALAWAGMQKNSYDLVVTDIIMPEMDGMQLASSIRGSEQHKHIPIVAVTSLMNESDKKRIMESGVDAYEPKLDKEKLILVLKKLLKNQGE